MRLQIDTRDGASSMGYWYVAIFHYFDECLRPAGCLLNARLIVRTDPTMRRIDEVDPDWAGGGNYFRRAIYRVALPERYGGGKFKAEQLFAQAIAAGPNHLANHWGRARYLYPLIGNREGYVADLRGCWSRIRTRLATPTLGTCISSVRRKKC